MLKDKNRVDALWDNFFMDRRQFIKGVSAVTLSIGIMSNLSEAQESVPKSPTMKYRILGRTGLEVSEISFGAIQIHNTGLAPLYRAFELGVNYIDTASGYGGGNSERTLSEFLKDHRNEVYVATKWSGHLGYDTEKEPHITTKKEDLIKSCEESLSRMNIETIDVIQLHGMNRPEQLEAPVIMEAFEELKSAGKVRFLGVTTHSNEAAVINQAVKLGYYDVVLTVYNFMSSKELSKAIEEAKKANVGVVIMKTFGPATQLAKYAENSADIYKSCLRWVLANKNITNIIPTMRNVDEVEQDISVVETKLSYLDMQKLQEYALILDKEYCRMCGSCSPACPQGVATNDIIRYAFYYKNYGDRDLAKELYRSLDIKQTVLNCNNCGSCNSACPYNLDVVGKLRQAHELLA
ncbi:MAG: aldo/keto reductase [bacterium]